MYERFFYVFTLLFLCMDLFFMTIYRETLFCENYSLRRVHYDLDQQEIYDVFGQDKYLRFSFTRQCLWHKLKFLYKKKTNKCKTNGLALISQHMSYHLLNVFTFILIKILFPFLEKRNNKNVFHALSLHIQFKRGQ